MRDKSVPEVLIAGWMREWRRCRSTFVLSPKVASQPIGRSRSLLQGDPAAPDIFNAVLDKAAQKFQQLSREKGWGYRLCDGSFVDLLLFADNFWIVSTNAHELTEMTAAWLEILTEFGWNVPLGEAVWCTTGPDEKHSWEVKLGNYCIKRSPRQEGFKVLGTIVTFDNSFEKELRNRMSRAWRAFWKCSDLLRCQAAPIKDRLRLLQVLVSSPLFWCCGSRNLTAGQLSKLRGIQQNMLQKMLPVRRREGEQAQEHTMRTNSRINGLKHLHAFQDWDRIDHKSLFKWAGHVARLARHSERLTYRVFKHYDWKHIQAIAEQNSGSQLHGRRIRTWRWERPLYRYFSEQHWQTVAQCKQFWTSQLDDMVEWRCRER